MADSTSKLPHHLAIIMDGNGRWAQARGKKRQDGHRQGVETARNIVREVGDLGIPVLTLFSFSSENWSRPAHEVSFLMGLIRHYIETDLHDLNERGVCVRIIGRRHNIEAGLSDLIARAETLTRHNKAMQLHIAFNYGGREEIADAATSLAAKAVAGDIQPQDITPDLFASELSSADMPDPDLLIRTSGEHRVSNFLLWQLAYSEFYFTDTLWPDFSRPDLEAALESFAKRHRRFGGLGEANE